ncbi:MAG: hypothetical protein JJE52_07350 [Acidimicrobiia bacterium]|nr:hypothetical protein [Acidimicrobiia bacterium]
MIIVALVADDSDGPESEEVGSPMGDASDDRAVSGECENVHAAHAVAMWSAVMADEMTSAECPWPYEPFLTSMDGGKEDASLAAPFEARCYDDLWQMLSTMSVGVCQVARIADWPAPGFVFGFTYAVGPPGCPADTAVVVMSVAEHATRALRDASAHDVASSADPTFVLGRWVITLTGSGDIQPIAEELRSLGAAEVTA